MEEILYLINSPIVPTDGLWERRTISKEHAKDLILHKIETNPGLVESLLNPRHTDLIKFVKREFGIKEHTVDFWDGSGTALVIRPKNPTRTGEELKNVEYEFILIERAGK